MNSMQTVRFADLELSRLMIGTSQFGLVYGIANKLGQPSYETVRDILICAYERGINCLDTAAIYGNSEEVLGKALTELGIVDKVVVVSKVVYLADEMSSPAAADEIVEGSVYRSLKLLKLDVLPVCLFHTESNFQYIESLLKLKEKGLIRHIGCSVETPEATSTIIASGLVEAVQMPTSLLDRRFTSSGICADAARRGVALFVRSIYLQGLLLMPEEEIIPELSPVIPIRRQLQKLADEAGISLSELAVRYVLGIEGVLCGVIGVEAVEQMRENIDIFSKGPLSSDLMQAVADVVPDLPDCILRPRFWSKRMPDVIPEKR